jgi:hypothetical protein
LDIIKLVKGGVLWFSISVTNCVGMQKFQHTNDLLDNFQHQRTWKGFLTALAFWQRLEDGAHTLQHAEQTLLFYGTNFQGRENMKSLPILARLYMICG